MGKVIFISGIDTDVGKTIATGIYAKKIDGTRLLRDYTKNDSNRL